MKTIKLTDDQIEVMLLAIKVCRDDYEQDFVDEISRARHVFRRLFEIENKLVKAQESKNKPETL
jgi:hypothetical protein